MDRQAENFQISQGYSQMVQGGFPKKLEYLEYGQALRWTGDVRSFGHGDEKRKEKEEYISGLCCAASEWTKQKTEPNSVKCKQCILPLLTVFYIYFFPAQIQHFLCTVKKQYIYKFNLFI